MTTGNNGKTGTIQAFDIFAAMAAIDLSKERPSDERPAGSTRVGRLNENLQRLFCLRYDVVDQKNTLKKRLQEMVSTHEAEHGRSDHDEAGCQAFHDTTEPLIREYDNLKAQTDGLNSIVGAAFALAFPESLGNAVHVGSDFEVWAFVENEGFTVLELEGVDGIGAFLEALSEGAVIGGRIVPGVDRCSSPNQDNSKRAGPGDDNKGSGRTRRPGPLSKVVKTWKGALAAFSIYI